MSGTRAKKERTFIVILYIVLGAIGIIWLFPIIWMFLTSIKNQVQTFQIPPVWVFKPVFSNYGDLFTASDIRKYFYNSLIITTTSTAICIFLGSLAAFALSRFTIRRKNDIAFWMLSTRMFPPIASAIPLYLLLKQFHALDTHFGLVIVYLTMNLGFATWMMKGFFDDLPVAIEESAMIDGCSRYSVFFRIALPLSAPGLASTGILCFIFAWNEFLYALLFTGRAAKTMPVVLAGFITETGIRWGALTAASVLTAAPTILLAIIAQKYIVRGLTLGAVK
ncbi:MAG: carbohydrate ABC transporter permease [Candidatus Atribacteria bacterium]|nr:carbohydrate ABC transporter permease [Candidatus Atribacteria bacterium]